MQEDTPAPLRSLRVVDSTDSRAEMTARYLADLGAEVVRVEPPQGSETRSARPQYDAVSLREATYNANKLGVTLDVTSTEGRETLVRLLATADMWITTASPDELANLDITDLRRRLPQLVIASITDFGLTGPYRDFAATEWVHAALSGVLCRSGVPGQRPLLPPNAILEQATAVQAACCTLTAYYRRMTTGLGDHLDISLHETAMQVLDPPFGTGPTAGYGRPWWDFPHGRPDVGHYYPVFPCADGHVRITVLSTGQWRALREWLGEPAEFQDPKYDRALERQQANDRLHPLIADLFATRSAMELTEEGQRRGVPTAPLLELDDVPQVEHFQQRGVFTDVQISPNLRARTPAGYVELDEKRAGIRHRSPRLGEHNEQILGALPTMPEPNDQVATPARDQPFAGLRVLDLGIIVAGAETGRLFGDLGAEVIKVENSKHPDGSRQPFDGQMSTGFAWGHRNKKSLSVDLRSQQGRDVFERLAATADVVLSNFKPGTLDKLGLGHERLREINPQLVVVQSSAVGHTGPWHRWMGYGPLVRAATGLTSLWQDPQVDDGFSDAMTVYPDHAVGRIVDTATLAVLIERRTTGRGRRVTCSQAETILTALSAEIAEESLAPGSMRAHGNTARFDAPSGVYPCAGDDEWCVITVRGDTDYRRLRAVLDLPDLPHASDRVAARYKIDTLLTEWTAARTGDEVLHALQEAGVPAGPMRRIPELADDPQLHARRVYTTLHQPRIGDPLPTEARQFRSESVSDAALHPAPVQGQHTRSVCTGVLSMTDAEVDELVSADVLEEPDPWAPLRATRPADPGASP